MSRGLILCADDYGMTDGIDRAILALADSRRLSAISCMVGGETWEAAAAKLKTLQWADIGLHVVLTDRDAVAGASALAPGGRCGGRARLAAGVVSGRIGRDTLQREIEAQIDRFVDGMGRLPDFVDAHQTVHLYPVIGPVLIEAIAARGPQWRPWLRLCHERFATIVARRHGCAEAIAAALASAALAPTARRRGVRTNAGFSGFYNVAHAREFVRIFPSFLVGLGPRHLVMCHPGFCRDAEERTDVWMRNREHEYEYLASAAFLDDLRGRGIVLMRFDEMANAGASAERTAHA